MTVTSRPSRQPTPRWLSERRHAGRLDVSSEGTTWASRTGGQPTCAERFYSRCSSVSWSGSRPQPQLHRQGAWTSNTGNGYYGGFQADRDFQRAYGREFYYAIGPAHLWRPWQQIVMAHRGYKSRGWQPWPTTSVMCGLR